MENWVEQYAASLDLRDRRESAHRTYIEAYTKLADRGATSQQHRDQDRAVSPPTPTTAAASNKAPTSSKGTPQQQDDPTDLLSRLRTDLSSTQRARSLLETQHAALTSQLTSLRSESGALTTRVAALEREKRGLETRLRDRDEELKGKARLVETVHDEMAGLNLQLNMAEDKAERLKGENEELVRRWMDRMGEEAERMNVESRWS